MAAAESVPRAARRHQGPQAVRAAMLSLGINAKTLAGRAGVSPGTISLYLAGKRGLGRGLMRALINALPGLAYDAELDDLVADRTPRMAVVTGGEIPEIICEGAEAIWRALQARGWSQKDLARESGVSQSLLSRYQSGRVKPGRRELSKLLSVLPELQYDAGVDDVVLLSEGEKS